MALITNYQASFTGGELAPSLHARVDLAKYRTGAKSILNWYILPHGGISRRDGLQFVGASGNAGQMSRLIPFEASSSDSYILEFGHLYMRVYRNGALVGDGSGGAYQIALPYVAGHLRGLVIEQSNDVLTVTHPSYPPREIARYAHDDWRTKVLDFSPPDGAPAISSVVPTRGFERPNDGTLMPNEYYIPEEHAYSVTAVTADGEETLRSTQVFVNNDLRFYPLNFNTVNWGAVAGSLFYNVYKNENGYFGLIGTTESTSFKDKNYKPNLQDGPPRGRNPFSGSGSYPYASAYFQQRRIFGGTTRRPQTTWASASGNYNNFSASRPAKDSDAIEFTIAGRKLQRIRHYTAMQDLIVFTESGEWRVRGPDNGILSPSSIKADLQSEYGIGSVPPMVVGDQVLFVLRDGRQVRDLGYKFESDNYSGSDLTVLSHHLFERRSVVEWAHQKTPNSIIWCVMDDGSLNALTYMREHEVWGWARHSTDGVFESVAVVRENNVDVPYFLVRRLVNGAWVRFIEAMRPDRAPGRANAFHVDSGLSYSGTPVSRVSGLGHLEGRTVVGLADGAVIGMTGELVVTGGAVDLPFPASIVHLGLPYNSDLESLSFALNERVAEGMIKGVGEVTVQVKDTSGLLVGPDFENLNEAKARLFEDYGEAPRLYTGSFDIATASDYDRAGTVCIRQSYPLPATILALAPKIDYAD